MAEIELDYKTIMTISIYVVLGTLVLYVAIKIWPMVPIILRAMRNVST